MSNWLIRTELQRASAVRELQTCALPCRAEIREGEDRSAQQNALSWLWYREISRGGGLEEQWHPARAMTSEDAHRECKLTCGVPILRRRETFAATYDALIRPHPTPTKIAAMDLISVTSILTVPEMAEYLTAVWDRYRLRVRLTDPGEPAVMRGAA